MSTQTTITAWAASLPPMGILEELGAFVQQQIQAGHLHDTDTNFLTAFQAFIGSQLTFPAPPPGPSIAATIAPGPPLLFTVPNVLAPTQAPTTFQSLSPTGYSTALSPTGGVTAGVSGSFAYLWRYRYVHDLGYSDPSPAAGATISAGTTIVRLKNIQAATDKAVTGILLERNKSTDPTGWYAVDPYLLGYTVSPWSVQIDDCIPDALLIPSPATTQAGNAPATLLGAPIGGPNANQLLSGDPTRSVLPLHPAALLPLNLTRTDGTVLAYDIAAWKRGY